MCNKKSNNFKMQRQSFGTDRRSIARCDSHHMAEDSFSSWGSTVASREFQDDGYGYGFLLRHSQRLVCEGHNVLPYIAKLIGFIYVSVNTILTSVLLGPVSIIYLSRSEF